MAVEVRGTGAGLELGTPHPLFKVNTVPAPQGPYDNSSDGTKFLMNATSMQPTTEPLTLVSNWTADLSR